MVYAQNVPRIVSPEARYFAPVYRRLLLDAVLTALNNVRVQLMNILWQTQTASSVFELCW